MHHPLLANDTYRQVRSRITDGVVDVIINPMPVQEQQYVESVLAEIDALIPQRVSVNGTGKADVVIGAVDAFADPRRRGQVLYRSPIQVQWRRSWMLYATNRPGGPRLGPTAKQLINHELLHAFGLSHPNNDARAPGFNYAITQLSDNHDRNHTYALTALDKQALQLAWGFLA